MNCSFHTYRKKESQHRKLQEKLKVKASAGSEGERKKRKEKKKNRTEGIGESGEQRRRELKALAGATTGHEQTSAKGPGTSVAMSP